MLFTDLLTLLQYIQLDHPKYERSRVSNPLVPRGFLFEPYKKRKLSSDRASSPELALAHHIKRKTKNAYAHAQVDADAVSGVLIVRCFGFTGPLSSITVFIKRFFLREVD